MEHFTERLRRGETPGTLMIRSSDEIGLLAENINYMVDELQKRIAALQEEKAKVEAAFSSAWRDADPRSPGAVGRSPGACGP